MVRKKRVQKFKTAYQLGEFLVLRKFLYIIYRHSKEKLSEAISHRVEIKKIKGVKAKEKKIVIYYLVFQKCF
ncbi:hypothetical protein ES703_89460 [subsurface metagenome]